jgi:hypothetical protein
LAPRSLKKATRSREDWSYPCAAFSASEYTPKQYDPPVTHCTHAAAAVAAHRVRCIAAPERIIDRLVSLAVLLCLLPHRLISYHTRILSQLVIIISFNYSFRYRKLHPYDICHRRNYKHSIKFHASILPQN